MKEKLKVNIKLEVPFESYPTEKLNDKARAHIVKWIKDSLKMELGFIPLYVEKDEAGAWIEDSTGPIKITVNKGKECQN